MKYLFVSDVHLGSSLQKSENDALETKFLKWLDAAWQQRATIYLLGDIFDFWFEYKRVIPTQHGAVLGRLREMVSDGIEIHFFKGNHDMWLRSYLRDEIGLIIHDRSEIVTIDGEKMMIGHGHDLCFKRSIVTRLLWFLFHTKWIYDLFSVLLHPNLMMKIGRLWSTGSRAKKSISHEFMQDDEYIVAYLNERLDAYRQEGVHRFIFGHFHCPTLYTLKDGKSQIMILGEWSCVPKYGEMENSVLSLKNLD